MATVRSRVFALGGLAGGAGPPRSSQGPSVGTNSLSPPAGGRLGLGASAPHLVRPSHAIHTRLSFMLPSSTPPRSVRQIKAVQVVQQRQAGERRRFRRCKSMSIVSGTLAWALAAKREPVPIRLPDQPAATVTVGP